MTTALDSYLHERYKEDGLFVERLTEVIREVLPVFYRESATLPVKNRPELNLLTWPYAIAKGESQRLVPQTTFSSSTHCMILFALDAFDPRAKDRYSFLLGKGFRPHGLVATPVDQEKLQKVILQAKNDLIKVVCATKEKPLVKSGTYGEDDPFTLTWMTEIAFRATEELDHADDFKRRILEAVEFVFERNNRILEAKETGFSEVSSSFLEVRRLHLAKSAERLADGNTRARSWLENNTPDLWKDFDDTIHRQLSYSSMGDPRFDPAELALAFEGALLLHPNWIGAFTIEKVFEALKLSRDRHPYWRPITPFLANDQGHVLFMISIEVANSILRSCEILDEADPRLKRFSQIESQLRSYAMWLLGELEEIADKNSTERNLVGWRTEYEERRNMIQLWHTSHVLIFLSHYASLLKRKIAADGIEAAGLQVRTHLGNDAYWTDEPMRSLSDASPYKILSRIQSYYIKSREKTQKDPDAPSSILLYGPPGTGKTTLAEELAAKLKRPLITVTVSDFLATGAAGIENRAKGVFEVLQSQDEVVILFDEIDQFLLDRNSEFYKRQSDVFKFMTPGMLTKLQDLRTAEGCIFVVATNYYERIDSAIRRRGRIDDRLLLNLPDQEQRLRLLMRFVLKYFKLESGSDDEKNLEKALRVSGILQKTVLLGYGDLKNLVNSAMKQKPDMDLRSLVEHLTQASDVDAAVSLSAYKSRFEGKGPYPFEEFMLLLCLMGEVNKELSPADAEPIHQMFNRIPKFREHLFNNLLEDKHVRDIEVVKLVQRYLEPVIYEWRKGRAN